MLTIKTITGIALATAAAGLFATTPVLAASGGSAAKIHCAGANACKGKSDCKTASNACKGHNNCKGNGFVSMSKETCDKIGGKVEK
jgi:uncharacterized membrane protein